MDVVSLVRTQASLIKDVPVGHAEWAPMFKNLKRIASIALLENFVPRRESESIWDTDKFAVRTLIEQNKPLILLQILSTFYAWKIRTIATPELLEASASQLKLPKEEFSSQIEAFEGAGGSLLFCCLVNPETHPTLASDALIKHFNFVLTSVFKYPALYTSLSTANKEKSQPVLLFFFLLLLYKNIENLPNDKKFFQALTSSHLLLKLLAFLHTHHATLSQKHLPFMLQALALVCHHELFEFDEHFTDISAADLKGILSEGLDVKTVMKEVKANVLDPFLAQNSTRRSVLQPLIETLAKGR